MPPKWPEDIMKALERAMKKMPASIRRMAFARLKKDVESRLQMSVRRTVKREDVLFIARQMVSGRMYKALEKELPLPRKRSSPNRPSTG